MPVRLKFNNAVFRSIKIKITKLALIIKIKIIEVTIIIKIKINVTGCSQLRMALS